MMRVIRWKNASTGVESLNITATGIYFPVGKTDSSFIARYSMVSAGQSASVERVSSPNGSRVGSPAVNVSGTTEVVVNERRGLSTGIIVTAISGTLISVLDDNTPITDFLDAGLGRFPAKEDADAYVYGSTVPQGLPVTINGVPYSWRGAGVGWVEQNAARSGLPVFFTLGDSISNDGGYRWNASKYPDLNIYRYSWQWYAQAASKSAMRFGGAFGQAGYTIEEIVSTWLPSLIEKANRGDYVYVLMGQNNLGGEVPGTLDTYASAIQQIESAGLVPILCTLTPGATTPWFHKLNAFIMAQASEKGRHLCDFHAAVTASDGTWINTMTRDGDGGEVHPNEFGAWTLGQTAANVASKLEPTPSWTAYCPRSEAGFAQDRAHGGTILSQLFLTDNGATPPLPTGWYTPSAAVSGALQFRTVAGIPGRVLRITKVAGNYPILRCPFSLDGINDGDEFVVTMRITSNLAATGSKWFFGIMDNTGSAFYDRGRNNTHCIEADQTDDVIVIKFTSDRTVASGLFDIGISEGDGGYVEVSQVQVLNLTSLGLA